MNKIQDMHRAWLAYTLPLHVGVCAILGPLVHFFITLLLLQRKYCCKHKSKLKILTNNAVYIYVRV